MLLRFISLLCPFEAANSLLSELFLESRPEKIAIIEKGVVTPALRIMFSYLAKANIDASYMGLDCQEAKFVGRTNSRNLTWISSQTEF